MLRAHRGDDRDEQHAVDRARRRRADGGQHEAELPDLTEADGELERPDVEPARPSPSAHATRDLGDDHETEQQRDPGRGRAELAPGR